MHPTSTPLESPTQPEASPRRCRRRRVHCPTSCVHRGWRRARGFTLAELMVVVAMIGVLAALAVVGYRQWIDWSMTAESKSLVQMLSNAQEAYYAQTKGYLNCSADWTVNELYPRTPSDHKQTLHDPGHANYPCWKALQVDTTDPTYMSFWVRAGDTAAFPPLPSTAPFDMKLTNIGMPPEAHRPWYIIIAVGDVDGDQHYNFFMSHSAQPSLVYSEDEN